MLRIDFDTDFIWRAKKLYCMKKIKLLLFLLSYVGFSQAQHTIHSKVIDNSTKENLEFVAVRLLQANDSSLVGGMTTDSTGVVRIPNVKSGNYILNASLVGYTNFFTNIRVNNEDLRVPEMVMEQDSKLLKDLEVTGTQVQVLTKGDTIEYNAAAFKTAENAVVEDLLKRMPGVEVTSDGKIMVNGQEVTKVRVDGKKFFGDDKEMSTKNIPADMIDKAAHGI